MSGLRGLCCRAMHDWFRLVDCYSARGPSAIGLLVRDSNGFAEIAVNQGRRDCELALAMGSPVEVVVS